jgi:hypothetical protein
MTSHSVWFCHHLVVFSTLAASDVAECPGGSAGYSLGIEEQIPDEQCPYN